MIFDIVRRFDGSRCRENKSGMNQRVVINNFYDGIIFQTNNCQSSVWCGQYGYQRVELMRRREWEMRDFLCFQIKFPQAGSKNFSIVILCCEAGKSTLMENTKRDLRRKIHKIFICASRMNHAIALIGLLFYKKNDPEGKKQNDD
ncbi:hypothetical protein SDC9_49173 [bioreactor metagenome]|uniref:Uncharacterized protein n=1 Tax=bioreactor metagenome TaxID=1076179 RepID=A0A644WGB8_9ZZZZ